MPEKHPTVTILIAARPEQAEIRAVGASRSFEYPAGALEILVARGKQPSAQRNAGIRAARGELIYFLDDDSVPRPGNLALGVRHFTDPRVAMVGGPNLCPMDAPALERVFAVVLGSWLAFGPSRARYTPVGELRQTSEKELILCNLLARRETLLKAGGFNEALYPNEENALMDQLRGSGNLLLYDPDLRIWRRPRATLKAFARMLMTYGRGRAEQFRVNPTVGSALNFVPPLFLAYLVTLPVLGSLAGPIALVPLSMYVAVVAIQTLALFGRAGVAASIAAAPLIVLTHVLYGLGFWRGLFTSLKPSGGKASDGVQVEAVKLMGAHGAPSE